MKELSRKSVKWKHFYNPGLFFFFFFSFFSSKSLCLGVVRGKKSWQHYQWPKQVHLTKWPPRQNLVNEHSDSWNYFLLFSEFQFPPLQQRSNTWGVSSDWELRRYTICCHWAVVRVKPTRTLWGSWAWEPFKQLLIREGRGCRDNRGAAQEQQCSLGAASWLPLKGCTKQQL